MLRTSKNYLCRSSDPGRQVRIANSVWQEWSHNTMQGFPQYAPSAKQGNLGVAIVSRVVDEFGWLFKRNHQEHDFGIDGQIEVVTDGGAVTGQMLGCQIKNGPSFFRESNRWGYVYRGQTKHFNYLANYPLPVIIIICDPATREGYWVRFRAADTQITEAGWRLTIPFENKLSSSKEALLAILPSVTDRLSQLKEYWRVNSMFFDSEVIIFVIDVEEVNKQDVSRAAGFRERLCRSKELALHCQGRIAIGFSGYKDDPRELFEIDEVKRYVALLDEAFPELFFFVRCEKPAATLKLFISCLVGVGWESKRSTPGNPQKFIADYSLLLPFLQRHFVYLNYLCEWLGLSEEDNRRITKDIARTMGMPDCEMKNM